MEKNPFNNVPVVKIGLAQWLKDHPSSMAGKRMSNIERDTTLNNIQADHLGGELDVYAPVEAYKQQWFHKKDKYYPVGEKVREDLPPIYIQWKDNYRKRFVNGARHKHNTPKNK